MADFPKAPAGAQETIKAAAAFTDYALMGPDRSLAKLSQKYAETRPTKAATKLVTLKLWSHRYNWQERARAYDAAVAEENKAALEAKRLAELEKMNEDQAASARAIFVLTSKRITDLLKGDIENKPLDKGALGGYALTQIWGKASEIERVARGAVMERKQLEVMGADGKPLQVETVFVMPSLVKETAEDMGGADDEDIEE